MPITMEIKTSNNRFANLFAMAFQKLNAVVFYRIAFGVMMALSITRFWLNGWIEKIYITPSFHFSYYGFEWVKPLGETGMYALYIAMFLSAIFIAFGFLYRFSSMVFFATFTYVELIEKSIYLNHYYFISLIALLLCFIPAHKQFSLDVKLGITKPLKVFPRWMSLALQLQMATVYFFAGIAKINYDWLFNAMPLKFWLPTKTNLPFVGAWLSETWVAYLFSWCGMLFDTLIPFFLFWRKTKYLAYAVVVIFHALTAILFPPIGMFPFIMMVCAIVFIIPIQQEKNQANTFSLRKFLGFVPSIFGRVGMVLFVLHFSFQFLFPFRYLMYPKDLFWHEQGFRFSWRVMLMEKAGMATFHVKEKNSNRIVAIRNSDYLTQQQEKQMSTQPDMILQFAHHLAWVHQKLGWKNPEVYVENYVTLNGEGSRLLINPSVNLAAEQDGFSNKKWILPYNIEQQKLVGAL